MKNPIERKKMVLAMEYIARQINDEDIFDYWLTVGVADGEIPYGSFDIEKVDDYWIEDYNFKNIMVAFQKAIYMAHNDGGLYCDDIAI